MNAIAALEANISAFNRRDLMKRLLDSGLSKEIAYRLGQLWDYSKQLGDQVIHVGRTILVKIVEFIEKHPHASAGLALGAALTALTHAIPGIGPLLSPIVGLLSIPALMTVGAAIDADKKGPVTEGLLAELVRLAHDFFKLIIDSIRLAFGEH
jgi:hypothetical protein